MVFVIYSFLVIVSCGITGVVGRIADEVVLGYDVSRFAIMSQGKESSS